MANQYIDIVARMIDEVSATASKIGKSMNDLKPTFSEMAIVGTAGFAAVSAEIYASVKAADEAARVQAQLGAVLKSTGGIAGVTADQAIRLSKAMQSQTTYSDEAVLSAENLLLTFTKIDKGIFPDVTKIVLDMSTALGEDLKSASIQVGKALQDPILGITALRRVGVNFNDAQKEVIKGLVETGHAAEAQALIMKELNVEFGGSAAAAAETYGGKMLQLKNQINDVQEKIGNALIPILTKLLEKIIPIVEKVSNWIDQHPKLTAAILLVTGAIFGLIAIIGTLGLAIIALEAVSFPIIAIILAIIAVIALLIAIGYQLYNNWYYIKLAAQQTWNDIKTQILTATKEASDAITTTWNVVLSFFTSIWSQIKNIFVSTIDAITQKINAFLELVQRAIQAAQSVGSFIGGAVSKIASPILGSRAEGGYIPQTGPYLVHEGEYVVPKGGALVGGAGGGTIVITGNTFMSDRDAAQKIGDMIIDKLKLNIRV